MNNLKAGKRVLILSGHPWSEHVGTLVAYEKYGLGWMAWRVRLDDPFGQECYAQATQVRVI